LYVVKIEDENVVYYRMLGLVASGLVLVSNVNIPADISVTKMEEIQVERSCK